MLTFCFIFVVVVVEEQPYDVIYGSAGVALVSNMLFNVPVIERINSGESPDEMVWNGMGWDGMFGGNNHG